MPLWSKNQPSSGDENPAGEAPTEHTRLLPNRVDSSSVEQGLGEPLNLSPFQVTFVKVAWITTIIFTVLTVVWWLILFTSIFLTVSRLHSPGSVFLGFSYTSIALTALIFHIAFFEAPAKLIRILGFIMAVCRPCEYLVRPKKALMIK
jgi:phage shock protein PspC (stress-responsive transcriptional regulator)